MFENHVKSALGKINWDQHLVVTSQFSLIKKNIKKVFKVVICDRKKKCIQLYYLGYLMN